MGEFEQQMKRLKVALGLTHDQEVAAALGMTKASLSDRKRRDSFPVERVIGLAGHHLGLDVAYVLTGLDEEQRERARRRDANVDSLSRRGDKNNPVSDAAAEQHAASVIRLRKEVALGTLLSWCTEDDLDLMLQLAARLGSTKNRRRDLEVVQSLVADGLNPAPGLPAGKPARKAARKTVKR